MRPRAGACIVLILLSLPLLAATGEEEARAAAVEFGKALTSGEPMRLAPLLPVRGKVRMHLARLGPEKGSFSGDQVKALFGDFLTTGHVRSFELLLLECDPGAFAMAHGRVRIVQRDGRTASVILRLAFQPENEQWVLREIQESAS